MFTRCTACRLFVADGCDGDGGIHELTACMHVVLTAYRLRRQWKQQHRRRYIAGVDESDCEECCGHRVDDDDGHHVQRSDDDDDCEHDEDSHAGRRDDDDDDDWTVGDSRGAAASSYQFQFGQGSDRRRRPHNGAMATAARVAAAEGRAEILRRAFLTRRR